METVEFEGWRDCVRLTNGTVEVVATTTIGPRILRYGFVGGPNAFHIIPETRGLTGGDEWRPYGGHRLWHAPEAKPRTYHPDNAPVQVSLEGATLVLAAAPDGAGIAKEMRVTLANNGAGVTVEHRLTNHNLWAVSLAPWALTIVANGGRVVLPQEPFVSHDDDLTPARPLVLWKFTDMADPRWRWGSNYITLRQDDNLNTAQKVGLYNAQGWGAHLTPKQIFLISIDVAPGGASALADDGCNFETFTKGPFQEMETLGPITLLGPGATVFHTERWFLARTGEIADGDASLDASLLPLIKPRP